MPRKRARKLKLPQWFDECAEVVAIVDSSFEVVYANEACCHWLDMANEAIIGNQLQYSSDQSRAAKTHPANGICPPPTIFESIDDQQSGFVFTARDTPKPWKAATFIRLRNNQDESQLVMVIGSEHNLCQPSLDEVAHNPENLHTLLAKLHLANRQRYSVANLIGNSDFSNRLKRQVTAVVNNQSDCLVVGPRGSGREHLARTIFHARNLDGARLIPVHCAIADSQLIQNSIKEWVFDQQANQTMDWLLLLDVDCLSSEAQSELLGYTQLPDFHLRVIATAAQPLLKLSANSQYSDSLASYLSVQVIQLAALEQRKQDIPLLAQNFLELCNTNSQKQIAGLDDAVIELFYEYHWPGNIDELKQTLQQAHENCGGTRIRADDLPRKFQLGISASRIGYHEQEAIELDTFLAKIEQELIERAMNQAKNNRTKAAELLGISRARFVRRATALGIVSSTVDQPIDSNTVDESAFKPAD